jgi:hypothetical protein
LATKVADTKKDQHLRILLYKHRQGSAENLLAVRIWFSLHHIESLVEPPRGFEVGRALLEQVHRVAQAVGNREATLCLQGRQVLQQQMMNERSVET